MATKSLALRPGAQPAAVNRSLQQVAHQEECCCHQCQAHGSQDTAAVPTGNTHYSVPETETKGVEVPVSLGSSPELAVEGRKSFL